MIQYIETKADGEMVSIFDLDNTLGPALPPDPTDPANTVTPNPTPLSGWPTCGTSTTKAYFIRGVVSTVETAPLDDIKARKTAEITRDRIAADGDHFTYTYVDATGATVSKDIRTADKDMLDLLVADARIRKGFPPNWPGGWKAIDNTYVMISTVEQWDAFFIAMYDAGIANFNHSQSLKATIAGATTPEQALAVAW